jgi:transglutaminase-like putative cysteine protease
MTFDTYFRITSYGLVGTAFAALSLTGELDFVSIVLYSIAFIVSFRADTRARTRLRLREWMWRVLALAYVPFLFIDGMMTSRITALVHMTLFLSAAKLFQDKRDRDWVFLYLIAFFQMLLAAGQTFDSTFIVSLGFFVFFFVSTLAAFEIRISRREINPLDEEIVSRAKKPRLHKVRRKQPAAASERPRASSPLAGRVRYLVGASFTQVLLVGILTLPFFFLIPRFGGGMTRGLRDVDTLTGFSDSVKLGEVARIKESQKVVMRVRLDHKPAKYIRWRGIALDRYSGDSWTKTGTRWIKQSSGRISHGNAAAETDEFESDYKLGDWSESRDPLEQKIVLEPSSSPTQTLFAAKSLVRLRGVLPEVSRDARSGAVTAAGLKGRIQYTAISDLSGPDEQRLLLDSSTSYPAEIKISCLQVPGDVPPEIRLDPRIKQLALEKTRGARTPYEKARAIETYLKTQLGYTLDLNFTKPDPLAEFLFDAKAGHCGYFATAMAVMMRLLDVPARIVNGFQMGDYNDVNGLYTVLASDAHTWVEVYFGDSAAWVEFDPTPAAGLNDYSEDGFLARLKKYLEAAEVFWLDYVVTLDQEEQASMMVELQHQLLSIKDQVLDSYGSVKQWVRGAANSLLDREWDLEDILKGLGLVAVLVAVTAGLYVALAYLKRRRRAPTGYGPWWHRLFILPRWSSARLAVRDPRTSAVLFYEQMLAITARAGLIKRPDETPIEFAAGAEFPQVHEITVIYNRLRFGGVRLEEGEAARVSRLLADLKRETRWEMRRKKGKDKQKNSSP